MRRPTPCLSEIAACGTEYSKNEEPPVESINLWRAATIGSVGTANGSLSIITHDNCSPRTSTPCQNEEVANKTAFSVLRNFSKSPAFDIVPCTKQGKSTCGAMRS